MNPPQIKLAYITGLRHIVLNELEQYPSLTVAKEESDTVFLNCPENLAEVKKLRSVAQAYLVVSSSKYNPNYISKHKSILGDLIEAVIKNDTNPEQTGKDSFKTFKISCAGSDSPEVRRLAEYIREEFGLTEKDEADIKIHLIKPGDIWEVGVQITPRPLSFRDYKVMNMSGAMDPTIAYAMNSLCDLEKTHSYLNAFSGSATLLIEAAQCYSNLDQLVGFDNDKKHLTLAIQNIKKARLIKRIQLKEKDILDNPDLGMFDTIVADLPFGMAISKNEDLEALYKTFLTYCERALNPKGKLALYTSQHELLERLLTASIFKVQQTIELKFITAANAYLKAKVFVCKLKQ